MNYMKRALVTLPLLILLCIAVWAVYEYKKPHTGAGNKTTDVQTDAVSLYNDFAKNEASANAKYLDKIIEVTGTVDAVQNSNGALVVMLNANQMMGEISCKMFDSTNNSFKKGDKIILKGKCAGLLSDVNLVDCVLLKN
jgi:putative nucleic acid binding protein